MFLLLFGLPMVLQFLFMGTMLFSASKGMDDPYIVFNYYKAFPLLMIVYMGAIFGWFWSIAIGLQKQIPADVRMKVKKFKILFFIPLVYILFISTAMVGMANLMIGGEIHENYALVASLIILPLHLFSMFCIFYSIYFVAKTFKTVELQRKTSFSDFAGEFFLFWFYPIGVWILQPKINKMSEDQS